MLSKRWRFKLTTTLTVVVLTGTVCVQSPERVISSPLAPSPSVQPALQSQATLPAYLPLILRRAASPTPIPPSAAARRVNAPYHSAEPRFAEAAIFWFGRVTPTENYSDVRLSYTESELYVYLAAFDRRLWYDTSPSSQDLTAWDSASLLLDLSANPSKTPQSSSYRFDAQFNDWEARAPFQAAYRGNGVGWTPASVPFLTTRGWQGDAINNDGDDKGWAMTFHIPFASMGFNTPPPQGALWRLGIVLHDRDDQAGTPIADKAWPEATDPGRPSTWGELRFGLPAYTPPDLSSPRITLVRQGLNGASVLDAAVGGYTVCGSGQDHWSEWGETNEAYYNPELSDYNIQNQSDISDWPCFSKVYLTFPLQGIPPGSAILSATLALYQVGNSQPEDATDSYIQVLTVSQDWDPRTITWNNAPLAWENVGAAWVEPLPAHPDFPGVRREWDVSLAAAQAFLNGTPLRLVLYSADSDYHSGKYFVSSDTGDWNAAGRPTLIITWAPGD